MALTRTWYTDANYAIPDFSSTANTCKSILWSIKALLKGTVSGTNGPEGAPPVGSRWTVVGSSDSVTGAMDGTDRWLDTFDATKIVSSTAAAPHSWIVLQSPAILGPYYLLIDYGANSASAIAIYTSKAAFTGGTASARPTSTTEVTNATSTFNDQVASINRVTRVTDANGNFWVLASRTGTGIIQFGLGVQTLIDVAPSDTMSVFSIGQYATSGAFNPSGSISVTGRTWNNGAVTTGGPNDYNVSSSWASLTPGNNPANGGAYDALPVFVITTNTGAAGVRGRLPDVGYVNGSMAIASNVPLTGNIEQTNTKGWLIPCSVTLTV